jgi:predicted TIM-barrel fold metal-dependent hydrolase
MNLVPNSAGTARPRLVAPPQACDAHMHIYDARFPVKSAMVDGATAADYRGLQARLGTRRTVVVTPRACGTDNRVTLDAINQLGRERTRGVAVVNTTVSDAELASLDAGGIRGIRFTLYTQDNAPTTFGMVEPLAHRVHELGWHLQLHWTADQIVEHAALLRRLPCPLVFDHLARLPMPAGIGHPAFAFVRGLLQEGRAWLKLSGAYLDTAVGAAGNYADATAVARAWVAAAPRRLVWGSDWPHPTERSKPDDAQLMDLLPAWAEDEAAQRAILVDNPAALYGFDTP